MIVKVIPVYPIPGILPKNKSIMSEMTLDLNKKEIIHCMQYGTVLDEDGNVVDKYYLNKMSTKTQSVKEIVKNVILEVPVQETLEEEKIVEENIIENVKEETEDKIEPVKPEYKINVVSVTKDDYINLEAEFETNVDKLSGNLYGIFDIYQGSKPTVIEYKSGENWIRFAKKFNSFMELNNGDKFVFRMMPKNSETFKFNLSIKEKNEVIANVVSEIDPTKL